MTTSNEQLFNDLAKAVGGFAQDIHVDALSKQDVEAITDATIEGEEDDDTDPVVTAMTNAVNTPMIGSLPVGDALNNAELDTAMSEYFNRRAQGI